MLWKGTISQGAKDEIMEYSLDLPAQHCVKFKGPEGQVTCFLPKVSSLPSPSEATLVSIVAFYQGRSREASETQR